MKARERKSVGKRDTTPPMDAEGQSRLRRWAGPSVLLLALFFLLTPFLGGKGIVSVASSRVMTDDAVDIYYPLFHYLGEGLRSGSWPLWCPLIFSGFPMAATQIGCFYPINVLLAWAIPGVAGFNLASASGMVIAALSVHALARRWDLDPWASAFGGLVFACSGFFVGHVPEANIVKAAGWLPLILLCIDDLRGAAWRRGVLLGGAAMGMQALAASPQITYYTAMAGAVASLAFVATARARWLGRVAETKNWPVLPRLACLFAVGGALGAVQLVPMFEASRWSTYARADNLAQATRFSFPLWKVGRWVVRDRGPRFVEGEVFIGVMALALAAAGILVSWTAPERRRRALDLSMLAVTGLLAASVAIPLLWRALPGFALFRFPVRTLVLTHLSLALWSAMGLHALRSRLARLRYASLVVTLIIFLVAIAEARGYLAHRWTAVPPDEFAPAGIVEAVRYSAKGGRIYPFHPSYQGRGQFLSGSDRRSLRSLLWPNTNVLYGTPSILGMEALEPGYISRLQEALWESGARFDEGGVHASEAWTRLVAGAGASLVVSFLPIDGPGIEQVASFAVPAGNRNVRLYRVTEPVPRLRLVHPRNPHPGAPEDGPGLTGPPEGEAETLPESSGPASTRDASESVALASETSDDLEFDVSLSSSGLLVVNDAFHPGWKAWVDGRRAPVIDVDSRARAVRLAAGRHHVSMRFAPLSVTLGLVLTAVTAAGIAVLGALAIVGRRSGSSDRGSSPRGPGRTAFE